MLSRAAEFARLSLIVERLLDADLLLAEEGGALLAEIEAARQSLGEDDEAAVGWHTANFLRALEALVRSGRLGEEHGRAVIEGARRMLDAPAG